jgi:hypothetical protein
MVDFGRECIKTYIKTHKWALFLKHNMWNLWLCEQCQRWNRDALFIQFINTFTASYLNTQGYYGLIISLCKHNKL